MFASEIQVFRRLGARGVLLQVLNFTSIVAPVFMVWKGVSLVTNSASPMVVVLSGSMEPAFYRGDLLFLTNLANERYKTGDITVFKLPMLATPIVHRVIETHDVPPNPEDSDPKQLPTQLLLTKGDNNQADDTALYLGLDFIERKHIIGKVRGFLPSIGYISLVMNDFPELKYALLGVLGLLALISRE